MARHASVDSALGTLLVDFERDALQAQHQLLKDLRAGAGMLLAATSLIASFLGSQALAHGGLTIVAWLAIGAFSLSLLAAVVVILPRPSLVFVVSSGSLQESLPPRPSEAEIHAGLQRVVEHTMAANAPVLESLHTVYEVAALSLGGQVFLWVVQLASTM